MIKLKVTCVGGMNWQDDCVRVLAIDDSASLVDLHDLIQRAVDFDDDHCYEFFIAAGPRSYNTRESLTGELDWDDDMSAHAEIKLAEIWPLPKNRKLYYWFDFGDDWLFEIKNVRLTKQELDQVVDTPKILERIGPNPVQYPDFE